MDRINVEEFYEVYKGVVSEYNVSTEVKCKALVLKTCVYQIL